MRVGHTPDLCVGPHVRCIDFLSHGKAYKRISFFAQIIDISFRCTQPFEKVQKVEFSLIYDHSNSRYIFSASKFLAFNFFSSAFFFGTSFFHTV